MASSIANTCASGLVSRRKECVSNGGKMGQFNGLRCVENIQVGVGSSCWSGSTSGLMIFVYFLYLSLNFNICECIYAVVLRC